ncbi:MAG: phosphatase PAP2 family protein [Planctomycetaceae bacterium]|nr:phosphatase PAP2 family protein [Planctomycetaceae bacterium]
MNQIRRPSGWKPLTAFDYGLTRKLNRMLTRRGVQPFFSAVSSLGDGKFWYALMFIFPIALGETGLRATGHMAVVGAVNLVLYRSIKLSTRRPRPCNAFEEIFSGTAPLDEYSFPSGHTMHAVAFTFIALLWCPQLAVLLIPFTLLVALSRVILGLHYPTDVLMGAGIGIVVARISLLQFI